MDNNGGAEMGGGRAGYQARVGGKGRELYLNNNKIRKKIQLINVLDPRQACNEWQLYFYYLCFILKIQLICIIHLQHFYEFAYWLQFTHNLKPILWHFYSHLHTNVCVRGAVKNLRYLKCMFLLMSKKVMLCLFVSALMSFLWSIQCHICGTIFVILVRNFTV